MTKYLTRATFLFFVLGMALFFTPVIAQTTESGGMTDTTTGSQQASVSSDSIQNSLDINMPGAAQEDATLESTSTPAPSTAPVSTATPVLTTDKGDYQPGETVSISGQFFGALQNMSLRISGGDTNTGTYTESAQSITADEQGSFTAMYVLDTTYRPSYTVVASDDLNQAIAQTSFTDAAPDLTVTKTNDVDGHAVVGIPFTWKIRMTNSGTATAKVMHNNVIIFRDTLPSSGAIYGAVSVVTSGTSGTLNCSVSGSDLTCTSGNFFWNWLSMPVNSFFDVSVVVTPIAPGSLVNPRTTGTTPECRADPSGEIPESNEGNNTCANTVSVVNSTGTIVIIQDTFPDDVQDFFFTASGTDPNTFSLDDDTEGTLSNIQILNTVAPGAKIVTMGEIAGFNLTNITCIDPDQGTTVDTVNRTAAIDLDAGETIICTFTTMKKGHLVVQKTTLPAGDLTQFPIIASGSGVITGGGERAVSDAADRDYEVAAGIYSVAEMVPNGWDMTANTCQNISVGAGETKTCLISNTKRGSVKVIKTTYGGDDVFPVTLSGSATSAGIITTSGGKGEFAFSDLAPGTYGVTEDLGNLPHWIQMTSDCEQLTVFPGQETICQIGNKHDARITVEKTSVGGDGQFHFTGLGREQGFNLDTSQGENHHISTFFDVFPEIEGSAFDVNEDTLSAWTTEKSCDLTGVLPGQTRGCSFVNTRKGRLIVQKTTDPAEDPTLFAITARETSSVTGDNVEKATKNGIHQETEGTPGTIADNVDQEYEFSPGIYSVEEIVPENWTQTENTCQNIAIAAGETQTCTITNVKQSTLTVVKVVRNTHGGQKQVEDFTLMLDDNAVANGVANIVASGQHIASEVNLPGYAATFSGDCDEEGNVTLRAGDAKICTITNEDQAGTLIVTKKVTNNSGTGSAKASDFTMNVTGTNVSNSSFPGERSPGTRVTMDAGNYSVSETDLTGDYDASFSEDCSGTITNGETKTCKVTNDDRPLIISEETASNLTTSSITITWKTSHPATSRVLYDTVSHDMMAKLARRDSKYGYAYSTSEADNTPMVTNHSVTVGGLAPSTTYYFRAVSHGSPETLGEELSATILTPSSGGGVILPSANQGGIGGPIFTTPNPNAGSLKVVKKTSGGNDTFSFTSSTSNIGSFQITTDNGNGQRIFSNLPAGIYSVNETVPSGWKLRSNGCENVRIVAGRQKTCIIQNEKQKKVRGKIRGHVYEDRNGDGSLRGDSNSQYGLGGWTLYLDTNGNAQQDSEEPHTVTDEKGGYSFDNLAAATYILREVPQEGWKQTFPLDGKYTVITKTSQTVNNKDFGNTRTTSAVGMTQGGNTLQSVEKLSGNVLFKWASKFIGSTVLSFAWENSTVDFSFLGFGLRTISRA